MVKRYELESHPSWMCEREDGEYVRYDDYAALEAEVARLKEQLSDAQVQIQAYSGYISTDGR